MISSVVYGTGLAALTPSLREDGWRILVFIQIITIPIALVMGRLTRRWVRAEAT